LLLNLNEKLLKAKMIQKTENEAKIDSRKKIVEAKNDAKSKN